MAKNKKKKAAKVEQDTQVLETQENKDEVVEKTVDCASMNGVKVTIEADQNYSYQIGSPALVTQSGHYITSNSVKIEKQAEEFQDTNGKVKVKLTISGNIVSAYIDENVYPCVYAQFANNASNATQSATQRIIATARNFGASRAKKTGCKTCGG